MEEILTAMVDKLFDLLNEKVSLYNKGKLTSREYLEFLNSLEKVKNKLFPED